MFTPDESMTDPANPDNHAIHQFCTDSSCNCHEDEDEIALINTFYQDGEVSEADRDRIYRGGTV